MQPMAPQASTDERGFIRFCEDSIERGLNVAIWNAAATEFARDPEASLPARLGAIASEVEGIMGVIEVVQLSQSRNHARDEPFLLRASFQVTAHLVNRMRAPRECT